MAKNLLKLTCPTHWSYFGETMWGFYQNNYKVDLQLMCNGETKLMHQLLLSVFCPKLKVMLDNESFSTSKPLDITDITDDADVMENLLEFLYKGEVSVEDVKLDGLKQAAESLEISGLLASIENVKNNSEVRTKINNKGAQKRKGKPVKRSIVDEEEEESSDADDGDDGGADTDDYVPEPKKPKSRSKSVKPPKTAAVVADESEEQNQSAVTPKSRSEYKKAWRQSRPIQKCPHCSYETRDKVSFKHHVSAKHSTTVEKHTCDICGKEFRNEKYFKRHVKQHTDNRNFKCDRCQYQTMNKSDLTEHMGSVHKVDLQGNPLNEDMKCSICDFKCVTEIRLKAHVLRKHTEKKHKCTQCNYSAIMSIDLRKHVNIVHKNLRPFQCDVCGKCSKTKSAFNVHVRSHSGIKSYVCDICGQTYTRPEKYRLHMQRHKSDEKKFICAICGHGCQRKDNLRMHMRRIHKIDDINFPIGLSANMSNSQESSDSVPIINTPNEQQPGMKADLQQDYVPSQQQNFMISAASESTGMQNSIGHMLHMDWRN